MSESSVKSAERVLALIELLSDPPADMSHAALAKTLDIPKSSLSQLLKTLTARSWISYSFETKAYSLGPAVHNLLRREGVVRDLLAVARAILANLTAVTTESSALNFRKGDETEVMATELSPQRLLSLMRLGDRAPLYATSGGKAILAFLPEAQIADYLDRVEFTPFTLQTLRSKASLNDELGQIRAEGVARSLEEYTPGVIGIACPIRDADGKVLASLNIALPESRYSPEADKTIGKIVQQTAAEILRKTLPR